ncbi:hypothetical protein BH11ACT8_BH11ACT8_12220 [soil metagenome]
MLEPITVDADPVEHGSRLVPVVMQLDDVPPVAVSNGWGDMTWTTTR